MPNVVAVLNSTLSANDTREILFRQMEAIDVPGIFYHRYFKNFPKIGMGFLDHGILGNGEQPVISSDGRWVLLLDGEIYNLKELLKTHQIDISNDLHSSPRECLQLFMSIGDRIVTELNGLFCILLFDRESGTLKIFSDRYAFRPLFYLVRGDTFFCASELKGITAVDPDRREIDEIGLLGLFSFGSHIMNRTWLKGYTKLPPASKLTVNSQGIQVEKYWIYQYDEAGPTLDQSTYFTGFRMLLDRAVDRCMRGSSRIGLFLSGGYDSRTVAAAIQKHHLPLPTFTFGYEQSRDVQYAQQLSNRLGCRHYYLYDESPFLFDYCRKIIWRSEGMVSFYNQTSMRYHSKIKEHADILLLGILGEFSGSHTWPGLLLARKRDAAIESIFSRLCRSSPSILQRIFQAQFYKTIFVNLKTEFVESFESIPNEHPLNIADSWQYHFCQHRNTFQAPSVDRHLFEVRGPHMDTELVQFLLTIPPFARLEQRVYKKMIAFGYPEIRDVPCTNSGKPINPNFFREYLVMVSQFLGRRVSSPFHRLRGSSPGLGREFRNPAEELRKELRLKELLLGSFIPSGIFPETIFNNEEIKAIVHEHYEGKNDHSDPIFLLISIGIAFEFFLYGQGESPPQIL